ncbi:hypothetical protein Tco_1060760 [Tanacetum coccineum]
MESIQPATSDNLLQLTLVTEIDEIKVFNVTKVDILKEVKAQLARHKNLFATVMSAMGEEQVQFYSGTFMLGILDVNALSQQEVAVIATSITTDAFVLEITNLY